MSLAKNLRKIRESKGLSQADLARAAKISQQSISRLESAKDLTSKHLTAIAKALGVPRSELEPAEVQASTAVAWRELLKAAFDGAFSQGATLAEVKGALDQEVRDRLLAELPPGTAGLSKEQLGSALEFAEKISDKSSMTRSQDN